MSTYIASIDALDANGRCEIASIGLAVGEPGYEPEVLLPGDEWAPLAPEQVASLRPPSRVADSLVHEIVRLPASPAELERIRQDSVEFSLSNYSQDNRLAPFTWLHDSMFIGHVDNSCGLRTTTVDQRVGRRNGIHLDNFERLPMGERGSSRRRLAINLGPGHRFLLVATEDVYDIVARHKIAGEYPNTGDVREFVRQGGELNCVRIRIEPGEGYVAPTELTPHDGSTSGADLPSRIAFWLGHWPTAQFPTVA